MHATDKLLDNISLRGQRSKGKEAEKREEKRIKNGREEKGSGGWRRKEEGRRDCNSNFRNKQELLKI